MGIHDQPVTLVASPSYPNSIAWSKENLLAVASGHLITILNPALPVRPRGLITLPPSKPFPIGVIKKEEILAPCVMPISLSRDACRPKKDSRDVACARSISWSPPGCAPNSGYKRNVLCLLAVCTTEGRVKLYRSPFCEFRPEWVEAVDISDILYHYLKKINFRELKDPSVTFSRVQVNAGFIKESGTINGLENPLTSKLHEHREGRKSSRRTQKNKYVEFLSEELPNDGDINHLSRNTGDEDDDDYDDDTAPRKKSKLTMSTGATIKPCSRPKQGSSAEKAKQQGNDAPELITARQYASRSLLLSSLIVSWSPRLHSVGGDHLNANSNYSILAVGGKSGNISLWRICEPQCYNIEHDRVPVDPVLIGLLQAHNSWITAISWGMYATSSLESQLVLATGSCDGSVKIWLGDVEELIRSSEADTVPFSLLREVTAVKSAPVSTISLVVPSPSLDKAVLAIGRGSGSLEACICHISRNELQSMVVYNAHNQVVTGLAWAFDGSCLYSCSQDNSVRSWVLRGSSLCETPFPLSFPGLKNSINLSQVSDLCFGLALSPGELVVAVVRSFDSELLNQMYQARIQKAAVEFYWTCGQSLAVTSDKHLEDGKGACPSLSAGDLVCWESTILRSLKHYDNGDEPLVLWDILTALLSFQKSAPSIVESILYKWVSSWFADYQSGDTVEKMMFHVQSVLSKMSTRRMHLLNVIGRRLILGESKVDNRHGEVYNLSGFEGEERKLDIWKKLLANSERELQERLVSFTFKTVLRRVSCSTAIPAIGRSWSPVGVAQMERWVDINSASVNDKLKLLRSKVGELGSRIHLICEYEEEERCSYCSASVPFETTGIARCQGIKDQDGSTENHELNRCSVSMRLGSVTSPMWLCMCCERQMANLPPSSFFPMSESPCLDVGYESESFGLQESSKPLCPFCGILLQRFLPDFLLSPSPV